MAGDIHYTLLNNYYTLGSSSTSSSGGDIIKCSLYILQSALLLLVSDFSTYYMHVYMCVL